jgi:hypothetical protein
MGYYIHTKMNTKRRSSEAEWTKCIMRKVVFEVGLDAGRREQDD